MPPDSTAVSTKKAIGPSLKASILAASGATPGAVSARPYPIISAADVLKGSPNPALIKGILRSRSVAMLYGNSGAFKTSLALDLALSVAAGFPKWFEHRVKTHGPTLYVAAEGGGSLKNRVSAWLKHHNLTEANIQEAGFLLKTVTLLDDAAIGALLTEISGLPAPPILIVIDTLSAAIAGADENGAAAMSQAAASARRIAEQTGAAVLVVHHVGKKDKRSPRGHTAFECAADAMILQERLSTSRCRLTSTKQRDDPDFPAIEFSLEDEFLGFDEDGEIVTSLVVVPLGGAAQPGTDEPALNASELRALKALADLGQGNGHGATTGQWREALAHTVEKLSKKTFNNWLSKLHTEGYVERVNAKKGRYRVTKKGLEALKIASASAI